LYVVYICYAVAGIVAVIASLQIYIKMNVGEDGIKKEILMVVGAILFIISASIVMPALFGYQI
jgi:type IV secretory pathway VirB2 component (pilin)